MKKNLNPLLTLYDNAKTDVQNSKTTDKYRWFNVKESQGSRMHIYMWYVKQDQHFHFFMLDER